MSPELEKVVKKLCSCVNADYTKIDFHDDEWFLEYSWTPEQEQDFIKWLADELYTNKELFKELARFSYKTKQKCKAMAEEFTSNYGWMYEATIKMD